MNSITDRVVRVLADQCGVPAHELTEATPLSTLDLDSLTRIEIIFDLEHEFQREVDDSTILAATTVADLVRSIQAMPVNT